MLTLVGTEKAADEFLKDGASLLFEENSLLNALNYLKAYLKK
ncbi:MAG: hypothetical protein ACOYUK_02280 [Patescibacteria group bacterium]